MSMKKMPAELQIPNKNFTVVKKIKNLVMSTMVGRAGLATTAGSNFIFSAKRVRIAPIRVDVTT